MTMTHAEEIQKIESTLKEMRALREAHPNGEIRYAYNSACDKLDVLLSKIINC
jgi:hypothetical protein